MTQPGKSGTPAPASSPFGWRSLLLGGLIGAGLASLFGMGALANVLALTAAAVVYFAVNSGLVAGAIALSTGLPMAGFWQRTFLRVAPACLLAGPIVASLELDDPVAPGQPIARIGGSL